MVRDLQPRVLVVVNKPRPDWVKPLAKYGATLAVFEIFQSEDNKRLFRVNGEHPAGPAEVISVCRIDELMRRWLVVETPAGLNVSSRRPNTVLIPHKYLSAMAPSARTIGSATAALLKSV